MPSVVKTMQQLTTLTIAQQLKIMSDPGDMEFLKKFIKRKHPGACILQCNHMSILLTARKQQFHYTIYAKYIRVLNQNTLAYGFYKII